MTHQTPSDGRVWERTYVHDAEGRLEIVFDDSTVDGCTWYETLTYDGQGRLCTVAGSGWASFDVTFVWSGDEVTDATVSQGATLWWSLH